MTNLYIIQTNLSILPPGCGFPIDTTNKLKSKRKHKFGMFVISEDDFSTSLQNTCMLIDVPQSLKYLPTKDSITLRFINQHDYGYIQVAKYK